MGQNVLICIHYTTLSDFFFCLPSVSLPFQYTRLSEQRRPSLCYYLTVVPTRCCLSGSPPFTPNSDPGEITPRKEECCLQLRNEDRGSEECDTQYVEQTEDTFTHLSTKSRRVITVQVKCSWMKIKQSNTLMGNKICLPKLRLIM